ncbi:MAG TPA: hypothetical protein VIJ51_16010 [Solirubrobacteraceae bacterium]
MLVVLAVVAPASADAASAPTSVTGGASLVTDTSAELAGTVNPNGVALGYFFQYGTTNSFGSESRPTDLPAGTSPVAVTADISGLTPDTTYFYRLHAVDEQGGEGDGAVATFITTGPVVAPIAITQAPVSVANRSAVLGASVNPEGQATAFTIEYGTTTSFGSITPVTELDNSSTPESVAGTASGLSPDTTYFYRVVAQNPTGTTMGAVMGFMTGPVAAPIVATGAATSVTSSGATLDGTVNPQALATNYVFEYGTTTSLGSTTTLGSAGSADDTAIPESATLSGLSANTTYLYRLVASNSLGTTTGAIMSFSTGTPGLPIVTSGGASAITNTTATLAGQVNPDGQATSFYGRTKCGQVIDDKMIEALAAEAERGYEPGQLAERRRGPGRPSLGEAAKTVESVRLDQDLRVETAQRAVTDGVTVSEVIRRALRQYLQGV